MNTLVLPSRYPGIRGGGSMSVCLSFSKRKVQPLLSYSLSVDEDSRASGAAAVAM